MANKKVSQLTSKPSVLVTDLFPIADPSTGQLYKTTISDLGTAIGSGVSSVNGLVGAVVLDTDDIQELVSPTNKWFTDTRARAALSASSPLAYNSGTGVFSIPAATSSQNGYLTSTDWSTFNSKQAALSGTGFVKISGTTISYDNSTYALDSAVVHNTGTESVGGIKTFTSQAVFNNSFIIKNTNSGSVSYGGNTTIWTSDDSFNILVGTASSTTKSFSFIYGSNVQLTLPSSDGTLALTSQLSSYLPLTGGTLTGALTISTSSGQPLTLNSTDTSLNQIIFNRSGTTLGKVYLYYDIVNSRPEMVIGSYGTGGRVRIESGNNTTALTLDASQNAQFVGTITATAISGTSATFSGIITANSATTAANGSINIENTDPAIRFRVTGGSANKRIYEWRAVAAGGVNDIMQLRLWNDAENSASTLFSVASSGAATFSSSVTTGGDVISTSGAMEIQGSANAIKTFYLNRYGVASGSQHRLRAASNYFEIASANSEPIVLTGGNVGIGTTSPSGKLHVKGDVIIERTSIAESSTITMEGGEFDIKASPYNYNMRFFTGTSGTSSERMRITSDGNLLVGITSGNPGQNNTTTGCNFSGGGRFFLNNSGSDNIIGRNTDGILISWRRAGVEVGTINVTSSATSYNTSSDYRLKQDLKPINGLDLVNKINVYNYEWKTDNTRMDGVLAHELAEVLPYAVSGIKDGERMQSVDYSKIVPVMVQAIKELKAKIETLENK